MMKSIILAVLGCLLVVAAPQLSLAGPNHKAMSFNEIHHSVYSAAMMEGHQMEKVKACVHFGIRVMHQLQAYRLIYKSLSAYTTNVEHETYGLMLEIIDPKTSSLDRSLLGPNLSQRLDDFINGCLVVLEPRKLEQHPFVPAAQVGVSPDDVDDQSESISGETEWEDEIGERESESSWSSADASEPELLEPVDSEAAEGGSAGGDSGDEAQSAAAVMNLDPVTESVFARVPASVFAKALQQIRHLQPKNRCINLAIKVMHNVGDKRRIYARASVYTRNIKPLSLKVIRIMNQPNGITVDAMTDELREHLLTTLNHCERLLARSLKSDRIAAAAGNMI